MTAEGTDRQAALRIADRLDEFLRLAATEPFPISLTLPPGKAGVSPVLEIHGTDPITPEQIQQFQRWLQDPDMRPISSGAHAVCKLLEYREILVPVEAVAGSLLAVDILMDIIASGDPIVKNSLYAIRAVANAYGLGFRAAKVEPSDGLLLTTPFIANLHGEHYVLVTGRQGSLVNCNDMGIDSTRPRDTFIDEFTGFVFASCSPEHVKGVAVDYVDGEFAAFVWG